MNACRQIPIFLTQLLFLEHLHSNCKKFIFYDDNLWCEYNSEKYVNTANYILPSN